MESSMLRFDENELRSQLSALPTLYRVAFAASCCERLVPNYHGFFLMERWGDYSAVVRCLDEIWNHLGGATVNEDLHKQLMDACRQALPDTDDFTSIFTAAALNAGVAI